jgi:alginate O-acetyltransferase complex protein AlgI
LLFNSVDFFIFFAIFYSLYRLIPDVRSQNRLLLFSSYVFYGWWDVRFLYLVVLSTGLDYCCGLLLGPGRITLRERLTVSICLILAALAFVLPRWKALQFDRPAVVGPSSVPELWGVSTPLGRATVDVAQLFRPDRLGWSVLLGTIIAVALANAAYRPLARMPETARRRFSLIMTVVSNLVFLGFFKYFNFFIDSAGRLVETLGGSAATWHLDIILPAGISFYTFQSLSYTIDVYYRRTEAVERLEDYALFVMFFPVLVAGPIERAGHMMPKLMRPRILSVDQTTRGLFLILFGLMKKVAVADGLAPAVNSVFNSTSTPSWADVVLATLFFTFQIYCDFSGYTDIARGIGKVLGIDLLYNFNLPYVSRSPGEFWQRWHISLSSWLRDYLYIPLGGNRRGVGRTYMNLMLTMILGGLWHGAAWNYVLWGFYHGALLWGYKLLAPGIAGSVPPTHTGPVPEGGWRRNPFTFGLSIAVFFAFTCYGWLLFRASSLDQVVRYTGILFGNVGQTGMSIGKPTFSAQVGLLVLLGFEGLEYVAGTRTFYRSWPRPVRGVVYALITLVLAMGFSNEAAQFIYFQF